MTSRAKTSFSPARIVDEEVLKIEKSIPSKYWRHFFWADHQVLRLVWTNFDRVAEGVYRSNQPDVRRFRALAAYGIRSVLNLRGIKNETVYPVIEKSCDAFDMTLVSIPGMYARQAPKRKALLEVLDVFEKIEKPFLIHCKSGADRTGLVSMMYLIEHEGLSVAEARPHLSFRYLHIRRSKAGILDFLMDKYETVETQKSFRDWVVEDYDAKALTREYQGK